MTNLLNATKLKVAIFNWFELRTPSTPSTVSHPSTPGIFHRPKINLIISQM